MTRRLAVLLLPFLLAAGACGSDDDGGTESSDTTAAASETTEATSDSGDDEALADAVVLKLADLPSGYTEGDAPSEEEEEEDPFDTCLTEEAKELDTATTAEGESPDFSRGETTTVGSISAVFDTEAHAEQAIDLLASDKLKDCLDQALGEEIKSSAGSEEGVEVGDVTLKSASFPNVAEETQALQFSIAISAAGTELSFYVDMVFFRQDRVLGGLFLFNLGSPFPSGQATPLAKKMAARMKAA